MKNIKTKIYHKLINNKLSYNTKSMSRYKKNNDKTENSSKKEGERRRRRVRGIRRSRDNRISSLYGAFINDKCIKHIRRDR